MGKFVVRYLPILLLVMVASVGPLAEAKAATPHQSLPKDRYELWRQEHQSSMKQLNDAINNLIVDWNGSLFLSQYADALANLMRIVRDCETLTPIDERSSGASYRCIEKLSGNIPNGSAQFFGADIESDEKTTSGSNSLAKLIPTLVDTSFQLLLIRHACPLQDRIEATKSFSLRERCKTFTLRTRSKLAASVALLTAEATIYPKAGTLIAPYAKALDRLNEIVEQMEKLEAHQEEQRIVTCEATLATLNSQPVSIPREPDFHSITQLPDLVKSRVKWVDAAEFFKRNCIQFSRDNYDGEAGSYELTRKQTILLKEAQDISIFIAQINKHFARQMACSPESVFLSASRSSASSRAYDQDLRFALACDEAAVFMRSVAAADVQGYIEYLAKILRRECEILDLPYELPRMVVRRTTEAQRHLAGAILFNVGLRVRPVEKTGNLNFAIRSIEVINGRWYEVDRRKSTNDSRSEFTWPLNEHVLNDSLAAVPWPADPLRRAMRQLDRPLELLTDGRSLQLAESPEDSMVCKPPQGFLAVDLDNGTIEEKLNFLKLASSK